MLLPFLVGCLSSGCGKSSAPTDPGNDPDPTPNLSVSLSPAGTQTVELFTSILYRAEANISGAAIDFYVNGEKAASGSSYEHLVESLEKIDVRAQGRTDKQTAWSNTASFQGKNTPTTIEANYNKNAAEVGDSLEVALRITDLTGLDRLEYFKGLATEPASNTPPDTIFNSNYSTSPLEYRINVFLTEKDIGNLMGLIRAYDRAGDKQVKSLPGIEIMANLAPYVTETNLTDNFPAASLITFKVSENVHLAERYTSFEEVIRVFQGQYPNPLPVRVSYNESTKQFTVTPNQDLLYLQNCRLEILADGVLDEKGKMLDGNNDQNPGDNYSIDFTVESVMKTEQGEPSFKENQIHSEYFLDLLKKSGLPGQRLEVLVQNPNLLNVFVDGDSLKFDATVGKGDYNSTEFPRIGATVNVYARNQAGEEVKIGGYQTVPFVTPMTDIEGIVHSVSADPNQPNTPVPDAEVTVGCVTVRSGPDGKYHLEVDPAKVTEDLITTLTNHYMDKEPGFPLLADTEFNPQIIDASSFSQEDMDYLKATILRGGAPGSVPMAKPHTDRPGYFFVNPPTTQYANITRNVLENKLSEGTETAYDAHEIADIDSAFYIVDWSNNTANGADGQFYVQRDPNDPTKILKVFITLKERLKDNVGRMEQIALKEIINGTFDQGDTRNPTFINELSYLGSRPELKTEFSERDLKVYRLVPNLSRLSWQNLQ